MKTNFDPASLTSRLMVLPAPAGWPSARAARQKLPASFQRRARMERNKGAALALVNEVAAIRRSRSKEDAVWLALGLSSFAVLLMSFWMR